ncbi:MAG: AHH domain-containing protein [Gammaproteobacteria bacterium]|nr:AHH domain-containing protein [Gammaproteobacteria bacterium]
MASSDSKPDVVLVEEEELLDGLLQLTNNNMGIAKVLFARIIQKHDWELKKTLQEMKDNIGPEIRKARREVQYQASENLLAFLESLRPDDVAVHHLVAWSDPRAARALEILLKWGIDPHDVPNLIYLPRFVRHTPHSAMPQAYAHSKVHTKIGHENVAYLLRRADAAPGATRADIVKALQDIGQDLQEGIFPLYERLNQEA